MDYEGWYIYVYARADITGQIYAHSFESHLAILVFSPEHGPKTSVILLDQLPIQTFVNVH